MKSLFRPFPLPLTGRQWFYLGFLQGVGAGLIDGGANFAIAYAMYHGQEDVRMWVFSKSTIAGDLGVTPIVQCLASMLITSTLVHTDLHHHAIAPLPFVYPHVEHLPDPRLVLHKLRRGSATTKPSTDVEKANVDDSTESERERKKGLVYYYLMLVRFIFEGTENNMMLARIPVLNWFGRFVWTAAQGAAIGIIFGFPLWCLAIVILGPIYGTGNMGNKWAPQAIKAVYGAVVGWVTNPVIATLALGSQAPSHLLVVDNESESEGDSIHGVERVQTIQEDEELVVPPPIGSLRPPAVHTPSQGSMTARLSPLVLATTPTNRSRTNSIGRVPLTADVRQISPYLPSSTPGPPRSPSPSSSRTLSTAQSRRGSVSSTRPTGRRRQSESAVFPTSAGPPVSATAAGFSYALGGTGGRAKRSNTVTSREIKDNRPPLPALTLPPASTDTSPMASRKQSPAGVSMSLPTRSPPPASERAAAWDVFGQREHVPSLAPTPKRNSGGRLAPTTPKTP